MRRVVIVPVYNEQAVVAAVLDRVWPQVDILIVVNDGSTDESHPRIEAWAQSKTGVYLVSSPVNRGQSAGLKRGYAIMHYLLERALIGPGDPVVEMDCDGQHDPAYVTPLIESWQRSQADIVLARRDLASYPFYKMVGNWGLTVINSLLAGQRFFDAVSNFRVASAQARSELLHYYTGYRYSGSFEANIIYAGLGYKTDNSFKVHVPLYRAGARASDGWHIVGTGLRAWYRVRAKRPAQDLEAFVRNTLTDLVLPK